MEFLKNDKSIAYSWENSDEKLMSLISYKNQKIKSIEIQEFILEPHWQEKPDFQERKRKVEVGRGNRIFR